MTVSRIAILAISAGLCSCAAQVSKVVPAQTPSPAARPSDAIAREGGDVFSRRCEACHAEGREHPGAMRLEIDRGKDRAVLLTRNDLNAEYVKVIVRNGYLSMPPFRAAEISDTELDALGAYVSQRGTRPRTQSQEQQ